MWLLCNNAASWSLYLLQFNSIINRASIDAAVYLFSFIQLIPCCNRVILVQHYHPTKMLILFSRQLYKDLRVHELSELIIINSVTKKMIFSGTFYNSPQGHMCGESQLEGLQQVAKSS